MPHFRVHDLVKDSAELEALEAFAREPGRSVDDVHEWLEAKGYRLARSSTGRWLMQFKANDSFRASNDVARTLLEAAKDKNAVAISDAAVLQLSQMIFEQALRLQMTGQIETSELVDCTAGLKNLITGKRHLEKLAEEIAEKQKRAIDEAKKVADAGGDGDAVVSKMREILGMAA